MQKSREDYLETILILSKRLPELHAVDIANELKYAKPSITRALNILKASGYLKIDNNNHIKLTKKGLIKAEAIYERHQFITKFWLLNGISPEAAERDACLIEHDISAETFAFIKTFVLAREKDK
ncbi:MAG: metal-dependent transcriptional regulator [Erysipelotrichaceae bacterium]|jgi:Mn-dependent DtxR family transcriptional regulator|nr:metal-dependent transcriptional regulator [Erysipelotrichaceae bacterium]